MPRARILVILLTFALLSPAGAARAVEEVGQRTQVAPSDLAAPYATPAVANPPRIVRRAPEQLPIVPAGFHANLFAGGLSHARWLAVAPQGDVFLAEPEAGKVTLLRDEHGEGKASLVATFADGFDRPHGMGFHGGFFYVADVRGVWRIPYRDGDTKAAGKPEAVTAPGAFGSGGGHWTRNIVFSPDGGHFFVTVGSAANIGEDALPRASIQAFNADGSGQRTFASGLRNAVGIEFRPGTSELFVVVNERDGMGDELPPDYLTHLVEGGFYGWPYAYAGRHPQPGYGDKRPDLVAKTIVPDLLIRTHSAPLGLAFYTGSQFPASYRGDAFVALHGSWNAAHPRGYEVVHVPFKDGRPLGYYENFATGFWFAGSARAEVWGRPVGLAIAKDGSLLIADDVSQSVWRVSYKP
ncbi:MAG: PQQ-dependent sugar dehydrogenase [Alphaproteobacteria bacterium]